MEKKQKVLNILVCGSKNFNDKSFVYGMMDQIYKSFNGQVGKVFTSKFAGACEFAKNWVDETNEKIEQASIESNISYAKIKIADMTFDMHLSKQNVSLYEELDIPEFIIRNDPFFATGKDLLVEKGVDLILAFPNPEGVLGPSTKNIQRFAKLAFPNVDDCFFDCSDALQKIQELREEELLTIEIEKPKTGFVNKHHKKI
jgi:hypothetical protein